MDSDAAGEVIEAHGVWESYAPQMITDRGIASLLIHYFSREALNGPTAGVAVGFVDDREISGPRPWQPKSVSFNFTALQLRVCEGRTGVLYYVAILLPTRPRCHY